MTRFCTEIIAVKSTLFLMYKIFLNIFFLFIHHHLPYNYYKINVFSPFVVVVTCSTVVPDNNNLDFNSYLLSIQASCILLSISSMSSSEYLKSSGLNKSKQSPLTHSGKQHHQQLNITLQKVREAPLRLHTEKALFIRKVLFSFYIISAHG